jgi:type I restriction enzyme S subunit
MIDEPWRVAPLGDVATLQRGFDLPTRLRAVGDVPIVSSSGISGFHNKPMVRGPGVVTGRYGTIGDVFFIDRSFWPHNTTLWVSDFHGNDPRFVYYLLQRIDFATHSGKSGVPGVNRNDLHKLDVSLPQSINEQRQIAESLTDADELIASLEQLIVKNQAIKRGMMQELLTGKRRLPGFSGRWQTVKLGDHFEITSSKRVFQKDWRDSGVPFYRARELAVLGEFGHVDNELFIDRALFEEFKRTHGSPSVDDFLVTGVGTLGKTYVVKPTDEFYFKDGNIIWFKASDSIDSKFLKFAYDTPQIIKQIEEGSSGTTVGTYTIANAKKTRLLIPPYPEQTAIAAVLEAATEGVYLLQSKLEKAKAVKQGMMQELLTGRTRLPVKEAVL